MEEERRGGERKREKLSENIRRNARLHQKRITGGFTVFSETTAEKNSAEKVMLWKTEKVEIHSSEHWLLVGHPSNSTDDSKIDSSWLWKLNI